METMRSMIMAVLVASGCGSTGGGMPGVDMADGGRADLVTAGDMASVVDGSADMTNPCPPDQVLTSAGTCMPCGGVGQECCAGMTCSAAAHASCEERAPGASFVDQCNACGYPGQRCCTPLGIVTRACADADTMCGTNGMCP